MMSILGSDRIGYLSKSLLERIHSQTELRRRFSVHGFDLILNVSALLTTGTGAAPEIRRPARFEPPKRWA